MVQGDAADDGTISKLVSSAIQEQGQLDVFFANVSRALSVISRVHTQTTFPTTLDDRFLLHIYKGWDRVWNSLVDSDHRRGLGPHDACQHYIVFSGRQVCSPSNDEGTK
jgi:hypothetical protein